MGGLVILSASPFQYAVLLPSSVASAQGIGITKTAIWRAISKVA